MALKEYTICILMELDSLKFDGIVHEAWEEIPARFKDEMENLSVMIEDGPTREQQGKLAGGGLLLGLFDGVPKPVWGQATMGVQPAKITIFRETILACSKNERDLRATIKVVLMHEVAHYFGYGEADMCVLDRKLRRKILTEGREI